MFESNPVIAFAARFAHEINRAYCVSIGDESHVPWERAPDWQRNSCMLGMEARFLHPSMTPEESHYNWCTHKFSEGWRYGEKKDPELKTHPALVPYTDLPQEQRTKDFLFKAVADMFLDQAMIEVFEKARAFQELHQLFKRQLAEKEAKGDA